MSQITIEEKNLIESEFPGCPWDYNLMGGEISCRIGDLSLSFQKVASEDDWVGSLGVGGHRGVILWVAYKIMPLQENIREAHSALAGIKADILTLAQSPATTPPPDRAPSESPT